jgi:hypothetical protein
VFARYRDEVAQALAPLDAIVALLATLKTALLGTKI